MTHFTPPISLCHGNGRGTRDQLLPLLGGNLGQ